MNSLRVSGIVVVAGLSSRIKEFKPLLALGDKTIIQSTICNLKDAGVEDIIVVVGYRGEEVEELIKNQGITIVYNHDYENSDMFQSVKIGIENLHNCDAFFVVPGDMPLITPMTYEKVKGCMANTKAKVVFPTLDNKPKHPPLISTSCVNEILNYESNNGLRGALAQFSGYTSYVAVDDEGCAIDIDTISDYKRLVKPS